MASWYHLVLLAITWSSLCQASNLPKDCNDVSPWYDGIYLIQPNTLPDGQEVPPFAVMCKFPDEGGVWTYIQNNLVDPANGVGEWQAPYAQYRVGFGDMTMGQNFWLGLDKLNWMTSHEDRHYTLRIELTTADDELKYAEYEYFTVGGGGEGEDFFISYGHYTGDAGDGLGNLHKNARFSTKDADHDSSKDKNCGDRQASGWWFNGIKDGEEVLCALSNLNGDKILWDGDDTYLAACMSITAS